MSAPANCVFGSLQFPRFPKPANISHMSTPAPEFVKPKDLAGRYRVSARTVRNWIARGELPALRTGRIVRVRLQDAIDRFERPAA